MVQASLVTEPKQLMVIEDYDYLFSFNHDSWGWVLASCKLMLCENDCRLEFILNVLATSQGKMQRLVVRSIKYVMYLILSIMRKHN